MEATAPIQKAYLAAPSKKEAAPSQNNSFSKKTEQRKESKGIISSIFSGIINFFKSIFGAGSSEKKTINKKINPPKNIHQPIEKAKKENPKTEIESLAKKELDEANEKLRDGKYSNSIKGVEELIKDLSEENKGIVLVIDPKDKHIKKRLIDLIPTLKGFGINVIALDYNYGLQPLIDLYYKAEKGSIEEKQLIKKLKTVFRKNGTANQDMALFEALRENNMRLITTSDIKEPSSIQRILKRIEAKDKPEDLEEAKYALILSKDKADSLKSAKHTLSDILGAPSINMHTKNYKSDTISILKGPQDHGDILKEQDFRIELPKVLNLSYARSN